MRSRSTLLPIVLSLILTFASSLASATDGVLEINQTCAYQTGCFSGDAPGLPVTITGSGSYLLTSNLSFNSVFGPPSTNFIEIDAPDVDLDLNGFSIRCVNALTGGLCTGSATVNGIWITGTARGPAERARVHDGSLVGMPFHGVLGINATGVVVQNLRVSASGGRGLFLDVKSRVEGCLVEGSASLGISLGRRSIAVGNVVEGSGDNGLEVGEVSIVRGNISSGNAGVGIRVLGDSVVEGNTASQNQSGFALVAGSSPGGLARENVANGNAGLGMSLSSGWVYTNNVLQGNNGGGSQTSGGIQGAGNYCGLTLGCP